MMSEEVLELGKTAEAAHDRLEQSILQRAIQLDNFFGKANSEKEQRTSYLLRWRNGLRLEEGSGLHFGSALRANFDLSRINDRLKLTLSGQDRSDTFSPSLPEDPGNPGFDRTLQNARIVNTELRYQLYSSLTTLLFAGVGIDIDWPPRVFTRARYQTSHRFSELMQLRFAETIFAKSPYGLGETTEFGVDRLLAPKTVLRWSNSGTVSQEIDALEWGSELSLQHELSPKSALTVTAGVYGDTRFDDWINNYRILLRYRRNFLRSWLYYELEPQVDWRLQGDGKFDSIMAFTVRLEVVFQGAEKKTAAK